jgi:Ca2+-binding EF-hand superfamily protein
MKQQTNPFKKKFIKDDAPFELDLDVKDIELNHIEKNCLKRVYDLLTSLEQEISSDDDLSLKKYLKEIEKNATKKMSIDDSSKNTINKHKTINKISAGNSINSENNLNGTKTQEEIKLSVKSIRKVLRKLNYQCTREEIELMIWEVDEDMDGYVSNYEFEKMYKRCVNDKEELEPKKLFYLVQFLMYDKDNKFYITEEDSLELLYIRNGGQNLNSAIQDIFEITVKDENGNDKKFIKEKTYYEEYLHRIMTLALKKRASVKDRQKNYGKYIEKKE